MTKRERTHAGKKLGYYCSVGNRNSGVLFSPCNKQLHEFPCRYWFAKEKALCFIAMVSAQEFKLVSGFHSLGNDRKFVLCAMEITALEIASSLGSLMRESTKDLSSFSFPMGSCFK